MASLAYPLGAQATGINDAGEIVGFNVNVNGQGDKSYKIQGSTVTALPALNGGANADPHGISSNGFIVGDADGPAGGRQAVEWNSSGAITALPRPANTFQSQAFSVDSSGVAVGDVILTTDFRAHAVMWANCKVTDLNAPGTGTGDTVANAINNSGVIVGGGNGHVFVYQNGTATDLNTLIAPTAGLTLSSATGINNNGQIAGTATLNGKEVGYILSPVS